MSKNIRMRVIDEAKFLIDTQMTIRELALHFKVSKSTIHKDLKERLRLYDKNLYEKVNNILQKHWEERHIRGGEKTRNKYRKKR